MAGVDRLVAVAAAGQDDADGRLRLRAWRGSGPARCASAAASAGLVGGRVARGVGDVEGVPQVARRVVRGDVEQLEVELVGLDLRALEDDEAELAEDARDLALGLEEGMQRAARQRPAGQRDVAPLARPGAPRARLDRARSRRVGDAPPRAASRMGLASAPTCGRSSAGQLRRCRPAARAARPCGRGMRVSTSSSSCGIVGCGDGRERATAQVVELGWKDARSTSADGAPLPGPCATSAMRANVAASRTAMSARTLRSRIDAGRLEPADELAVGEAVLAGGGVEPDDPQGAQLALALLAADDRRRPSREAALRAPA